MLDRSLAPVIVNARIGRTDLGQVALSFEDDASTIALRDASGEHTVRIELSSVEGVYVDGSEVTIPLRDGTRLVIACDTSAELREAILGRCLTLPELTRTLRTFGSRRGAQSVRATAGDEQRRFFAPLLDARRLAMAAPSPVDTVGAFDADALLSSIHRVLQAFAAQRVAQLGPARRALEAELFDAVEPLQESLRRVRDAATRAGSTVNELRPWRVWTAELRGSFEIADRVWLTLDEVLESVPIPAQKSGKAK